MYEKLVASTDSESDVDARCDTAGYKNIDQREEKRMDADNIKPESDDESKIKHLPFFSLFRYSTKFEKLLILMAGLFSIVSGFAYPLLAHFLGEVTNIMVNYDLSRQQTASNERIVAKINGAKLVTDDEFTAGVIKFCLCMFTIGVMLHVAIAMTVWMMNYTAEMQIYRIRKMYMKAMLRQDISWFDTHQSAEFSSKVGENLKKLQMGMGDRIALMFYFISIFVTSVTVALFTGWKLTAVMLSITPLLSISAGALSKVQTEFAFQELEAYGKAAVVAEEVLGAIRTVTAFGGEKKEIKRYAERLSDAKKSGIKRGIISALGLSMTNLFLFVTYALSFWYGVKLVIDARVSGSHEYTPGDMLNIFMNVMIGAMYIGQITPFIEVFATAKAAAASIFQIIERKPPINSFSSKGKALSALKGNIKFDNVSFNYSSRSSVTVLKNLSFEVESGKTIALVGKSGCGKSTVTQLIQRFYDPCFGSVMIDGVNIKYFNVGWLRENIGFIEQEPVLFSTTIKENIRYGREDVTDDEIIKATTASNVHDFIMNLPARYNTLVGANGTQMSGGQKQRLAIARALVRNPKILLLDEATSALDSESESIVQAALDKASKGRTTIIIAHRLSTVRNADTIIVISDGTVREQGTHEQLMKNQGVYYQLIASQIVDTTDSRKEENIEKKLKILDCSLSRKLNSSRKLSGRLSQSGPVDRDDAEDVTVSNVVWNTFKLNFPELHFIIVGLILTVLVGISYTVYSYYFGQVLNIFSFTDNETARSQSVSYALIFLAIGLATGLSTFVQVTMFAISGENLTMRIRELAFEAMLKQEMSWHDDKRNSKGVLCAQLSSDASGIQGATGARLATLIRSISTMGAAVALSFYLNWQLSLIVGAFIPLIFTSVYYDGKSAYTQTLAEKSSLEEGNMIAVEALENIRTVASLHRERMFYKMYVKCFKSSFRLALRNTVFRAFNMGLSHAVIFFAYAATFYYGGDLIKRRLIRYKDLYIILEAVLVSTLISAQAVVFTPDYQNAKASAIKIFKLLWRKSILDPYSNNGVTPTSCQGKLSFEKVSFCYPSRPNVWVLNDVSFLVQPGRTVALVGSSGCGKSTCIQLIERFYDPDTGSLMVDGTNTSDSLNMSWMRSTIGLVQQEPVLFGYSIRENIAYGDNTRDDVPMTEIIDAARLANIHSFITSLPQGYETNVGSRGTQMSGGQKQRIAIARALIRKPKLLLLDEATSALDSESEKNVEEALAKASEGRSCITIAHRLSTIQNADLIVTMEDGSIVEMGTHQDLIKLEGVYHSFFKRQQGSFKDQKLLH
ncbi:pgp-2 (predicted) [Pycnogonum litorale]